MNALFAHLGAGAEVEAVHPIITNETQFVDDVFLIEPFGVAELTIVVVAHNEKFKVLIPNSFGIVSIVCVFDIEHVCHLHVTKGHPLGVGLKDQPL